MPVKIPVIANSTHFSAERVTFSPNQLSIITWVNKLTDKLLLIIKAKGEFMKTRNNSRIIRNTLIAVTAMALPMLAMASPNISVSFASAELESTQGQQRIYEQMRNASRELCGSSNIALTGSIDTSVANAKCYSGTLTAAVQRLDNDAITELHAEL